MNRGRDEEMVSSLVIYKDNRIFFIRLLYCNMKVLYCINIHSVGITLNQRNTVELSSGKTIDLTQRNNNKWGIPMDALCIAKMKRKKRALDLMLIIYSSILDAINDLIETKI